ncbi:SDR family NAD(P)-dependent oxidoreductase [Nisaea nitritireducens]|uniref:SDR family NAD(P)-dependent oxidoreductase n=1 Tax=Nisaea nitritireducens TaxID=568392 RepID=UPI001868101C|nr:SDR family NAD(P)-dependent oxidoreductase [Nisaea nitritireducens]
MELSKPVETGLADMNRHMAVLLDGALSAVDLRKVSPKYEPWVAVGRELLSEIDLSNAQRGEGWRDWDAVKGVWLSKPELAPQVRLVEACLKALPDLLTGQIEAHEVLFPEGSMDLVEGVHTGNKVADYFNDILCRSVEKYIEGRVGLDPEAQIRVLEVGGGVGATTAGLLEGLKPYSGNISNYCFTDLSKAFLDRAGERFRPEHSFFSTAVLDIDTAPRHQGFAADSYDLIVASNVLHVASNIRETLRGLKSLLHCNGLLFVNELSERSLFTHLTFGLLDVWWSYEDGHLRIPGCPGLTPDAWKATLVQEGFPNVLFPAEPNHDRGQQILIAESDGIVRSRRAAGTDPVHLEATETPLKASKPEQVAPSANGDEKDRCAEIVTRIVSDVLKIPSKKIDPARSLTDYGLDSIIAIQLTKAMKDVFPSIRTTTFFEADTITSLVEYLLKNDERPGPSSGSTQGSGRPEQNNSGEASSRASRASNLEGIAIIGLSGRYPGSSDVDNFWRHLVNGEDLVTRFPEDRWPHAKLDRAERWGGFLDRVGAFDPLFFDISPREAELMSPEERLFLETVWNLLESACHTRNRISRQYDNRVGVYVGAMYQHYRETTDDADFRAVTSLSSFSAIANRISHFFDFNGPSVAVDTMCSASAVAIHMACESLRKGECSLAVAGGVNLSLYSGKFDGLEKTQLIASGPASRSFSDGDGYLPAEAVGAVLLKPLAQACEDNDEIFGVIRASAINHNGHTASQAVPNPKAQRALIEDNFQSANIDPRTVGYVEAAANGSALGDAMEVSALSGAFREFTDDRDFCVLGSVKSNIGHPEAASGIAQLTKVVMQLRHRKFVPSVGARPLNPDIDLSSSPFAIIEHAREWPAIMTPEGMPLPRRATVSSFGGGGTNAHFIVEEFDEPPSASSPGTGPWPVMLSARSPAALRAAAGTLLEHIKQNQDVEIGRVSWTLAMGREAMEERLGLVVSDRDGLAEGLRDFLGNGQRNTTFRLGSVDLGVPTAPNKGDTPSTLLDGWLKGQETDWSPCFGSSAPGFLVLPTYPFERQDYWLPAKSVGPEVVERSFEFPSEAPCLKDHGSVLPAVAALDMVAATVGPREDRLVLKRIVWNRPMAARDGHVILRVIVEHGERTAKFRVLDDGNVSYCAGALEVAHFGDGGSRAQAEATALERIRAATPTILSRSSCDEILKRSNGPSLFSIDQVRYGEGGLLAQVRKSNVSGPGGLDLGLLNSLVLSGVIWQSLLEPGAALPQPFTLEEFTLSKGLPDEGYVHVRKSATHSRSVPKFDISLSDKDGNVSLSLKGFTAASPDASDRLQGIEPVQETVPSADHITEELVTIFSAIQKIDVERIKPQSNWARYGMTSVGFTEFTEAINDRYGLDLMPTVFFEHPTLASLTSFLSRKVAGSASVAKYAVSPADKPGSAIAIVGISARLPGADNPAALWNILANNKDMITEVPKSRWDWRDIYGDPHQEPGKTRAKWGGFIADMDCFDPLFFDLSPRDAEGMDPQARLVMESSWAALEDAGYTASAIAGTDMGVFVGVSTADYKDICRDLDPALSAQIKPFLIANRVSYFLDLHGPSEIIDTACSSSLVAIHRAAESIRQGSCRAALVGGVNVLASPEITLSLSKSGVLSEDGRCMAFDSRANGMVRGEGVGMVVLKPLAEAQEAGDRIYAVLRGTAVNHDGQSSSASAPNPKAQSDLIVQAMFEGGIAPETVGYVEAHGTGTELGDPIEMKGLRTAYEELSGKAGEPPVSQPYCAVGTIKANIGHLEAAAGIAGLIKVLLMFKHGLIPGNPHLQTPNRYLELQGGPFYLAKNTAEWPQGHTPRRAAVSSFGIGGANAHVVLEEYPAKARQEDRPISIQPVFVPLSAKDEAGLKRVVHQMSHFVKRNQSLELEDFSYTLQVGREALPARLVFSARSMAEVQTVLEKLAASESALSGTVMNDYGPAEHTGPLKRWGEGGAMDWSELYDGPTPNRITLPTYPFERKRYWVAAPEQENAELRVEHARSQSAGPVLLCRPVWEDAETSIGVASSEPPLRRLVYFCGRAENPQPLEEGEHCFASSWPDIAKRFEDVSTQVFEEVQSLLASRPKEEVLLQVVVDRDGEGHLYAALNGLFKTAAKENSRIHTQLIEIEAEAPADMVRTRLTENRSRLEDTHIRYLDGARQRLVWREAPEAGEEPRPVWKENGTYLITGGMGGLGTIFGEEIVRHCKNPTLILVGRSRLNPDAIKQLENWTSRGADIHYRQIDIGRSEQIDALVDEIRHRHGTLNGVLHCAGVNRGRYILKKTAAEFRSVLSPKVAGTVYLDAATRDMALDFFIMFASGSGAIGYPGQADYATANGFLDYFSEWRANRVAQGERSGRSLAIDWPLWKSGGMRVEQGDQAALADTSGMVAMETEQGLAAFYDALNSGYPQVGVVAGNHDKIRATFLAGHIDNPKDRSASRRSDPSASGSLTPTVREKMKELVAKQVRLPAAELDLDASFEVYGIDSIAVTELNQKLEEIFGPVPKTLLFEVQSIRELADYFIEDYADECRAWCGQTVPVSRPERAAVEQIQERGNVPRNRTHQDEPVAIIGMAGRFPDAPDLDQFWMNLQMGRDSIKELPSDRWPLDGFFEADPDKAVAEGKSYSKWGGFLESVFEFDPQFFGISPKEALMMDPQERLFLQTAWAALEDSGYCKESLKSSIGSRVGVFAGITKTGYDLFGPDLWRNGEHVYPHTSFGSIANRVSYILDLKGPSMPIDTLCSASLTALHEARIHILRGECDMSLVGGVNLYLHPSSYTSLCAYGFLARSHRCKSFGEGGDGFVPGEGVGVLVLKRLSLAERDGDEILATLEGTSVNHDGKTSGYTVPNPKAQSELVRQALSSANINARDVSYVEAHGTGTKLGDPIEVRGLSQAFREDTDETSFAALGSVKSNIGHLEAAAGVAGVIKILLQMKHGKLAPSLHAEKLNENIDFPATPFTVQRTVSEWPGDEKIAGISSFGAGGSNAHAILKSYRKSAPHEDQSSDQPEAIILSARSEDRLKNMARNLLAFVRDGGVRLSDLAYTLQVGRTPMECRLGFIVNSTDDLVETLERFVSNNTDGGVVSGRVTAKTKTLEDMLGADEATGIVDGWLRKGELDKLLEQWSLGYPVSWQDLARVAEPRKMRIPTYPFAHDIYRLETPEPIRTSTASSDHSGRHDLFCFRESWAERAVPRETEKIGGVLCFVPGDFDPAQMAELADDAGLGEFACRNIPSDNDWGDLEKALAGKDRLMFVGNGEVGDALHIASLLRSIGSSGKLPAKLVLAGRFEDPVQRAHMESWIGFERSLRISAPQTAISVVFSDATMSLADWMRTLSTELRSPCSGAVLYSGGTRKEPLFEALSLPQNETAFSRSAPETVVITGGCGGLGYLVARHLAGKGGINLVLTGRRPLDAEIKRKLKALEASGAGVLYLQADVADRQAMEAGLAEARERFGTISGLIHAAGVEAKGSIFENDAADFQSVTAPKIEGAFLLKELLSGDQLRFVCFFSSSAATLGDFGSCDYAVANRFLMAWGAAWSEPVHVINWPLWRDGGMGKGSDDETDFYLETSGQRMLEQDEGLELFDRIIANEGGDHLVLAGKAEAVKRFLGRIEQMQEEVPLPLEERLMLIAGKIIDLPAERFDNDRSFSDFGFDSVSLASFAGALSEELGVDVASSDFYGHPTFEALAAYLNSAFSGAVAEETTGRREIPVLPIAVSAQPQQPRQKRQDVAMAVDEPIAIIGMSGCFPGANSVGEFWQNVRQAKSAISTMPKERLTGSVDGEIHGAFVDGIDRFDPLFFGIPPAEAENLDPRQRTFLQVAWHALEDAGAMGERIRGAACGVYVGVEEGLPLALGEGGDLNSSQNATLAARISYMLDLKGPSLALTTACSSSLVALHQACMGLRHGDCEMALVGGVNLILSSDGFGNLKSSGLLSSDGVCRVFEQSGDGLVPGEAVAAVLLKPLAAALRDGDPVYACVTASAVNYDGKTNGITAPSPVRQTELLEGLYEKAGIDPASLQLVMAHSVGAQVSDGIEIDALTTAFQSHTEQTGFCALRSVKPLIGHTFAASGLVSLITAVMAMKHRQIPGLNLDGDLNERIDPATSPFNFDAETREWPRPAESPRRAALGATGISGTNVHVLLEEAPDPAGAGAPTDGRPLMFAFSAKSPDRLMALLERMASYVETVAESDLAALARTLIDGRDQMKCRMAILASSIEQLRSAIRAQLDKRDMPDVVFQGRVKQDKNSRADIDVRLADAYRSNDLPGIARAWCSGARVSWSDMQGDDLPTMLSMPGYPFEQRQLGNKPQQETEQEGTVAELYRTIAELERPEFREGFLTFFPLLEKRPGFSVTRIGLHPQDHPEEVALVHEKQKESRSVLFHGTDFDTVESLVDFGCGYGTDVVGLGKKHPHLLADGYTITPAQAEIAQDRIRRENLSDRVRVFNRDSTRDPFPQRYDIALGVEVTCHIEDKDGLFDNVLNALRDDGRVLLMDFVSNMKGGIVDPNVSVYIPTQEEWIDLISRHGLALDESVDLSAQIANSITDPECEENVKGLPKVLADSWRNWTNNAVAIERGWVGYRFFKMRRVTGWDEAALRRHNKAHFGAATGYPEALAAMLAAEPWQPRLIAPEDAVHKTSDEPTPRVSARPLGKADLKEVRERLAEVFTKVLRLEKQDLQTIDTIQELGLDSLNAVSLLEAINSEFDLTLPTSTVFEFATIAEIAAYIAPRIKTRSDVPLTAIGEEISTEPQSSGNIVQFDTGYKGAALSEHTRPAVTAAPEEAAEIAIVGMSCRCAGAEDVDSFWNLVSEGQDAISDVTDPAWLNYLERHSESPIVPRYGAMADIDKFDPLFFRISPKEADAMGVNQRLLLEECYHALESSGYAPDRLADLPVGTYVGLGAGFDSEEPEHSHLAMLGLDTSIAAARIAYLLDLKGPALAVNTACSSSLVAVDLASKALRNREVDMALAGGITVWDHPAPFVSMNNAGMLSPTGQCRPFDRNADGIIVGDGVGIVVLKRLSDAIADGDSVLAVIKGSGTNQDGRTSGITVPSFLSQSRLQSSVYQTAGTNAGDIQYVEAHGTATKLGDPVELHALTESFSQSSNDKGFCATGSVKANIGHTAAASGVLGLIKVVAALEHGQMPPSIHYEEPNEHIDFASSPFYVNTALTDWPRNKQGERLAAVSSFGYSGTNAHVLVKSAHLPERRTPSTDQRPQVHLIVLSARDRERLKRLAERLCDFISGRQDRLSLADIAYTLQVGRDAMEERVAFEASDMDGLLKGLRSIAMGESTSKTHWHGHSKQREGAATLLVDDDDAEELIARWLAKGRLHKLAELWVTGGGLDWRALHGSGTPRRVRLPGYPFARRACRLPTVGVTARPVETNLHPLIHRNTSGLAGVSFASTFTGSEPVFSDHQVAGRKMLPATAYLELAVAAVTQASDATPQNLLLRDMMWVQPITSSPDPLNVLTRLQSRGDGEVQVEIGLDGGGTSNVAARCKVLLRKGEAAADLDLTTLGRQTSGTILSADDCYEIFAKAGVIFGPSHRVLEQVRVGEGQVLAQLKLPRSQQDSRNLYHLHPGLLDGAFQATVGFMHQQTRSDMPARPMLPFALREMQVLGSVPDEVWVHIRHADGGNGPNLVLDLDLCDGDGSVCVRLKGLTARTLDGAAAKDQKAPAIEGACTLYAAPSWVEREIVVEPSHTPDFQQRIIVTAGLPALKADKATAGLTTLNLGTQKAEETANWIEASATRLFEQIKALLENERGRKILMQLAVPNSGDAQLVAGLSGLLKTARMEFPNFYGQVVEVPAGTKPKALRTLLDKEAAAADSGPIKYADNRRRILQWNEFDEGASTGWAWKNDGVYLITGGLGGLGLLFAEEIAARTKCAKLVLLGRSEPDADARARLAAIEKQGAEILVRKADVSRLEEVSRIVEELDDSHGGLTGVIHAAGIIRDGTIRNKSAGDFQAVLGPKITGTFNLDKAVGSRELDFFVLFSSGAGIWGNAGQADYSAANAVMDQLARRRNQLVGDAQRHGRTLSINWPLWRDGGMNVGARVIEKMARTIGAVPLEARDGFAAFECALGSDLSQISVMRGNPDILRPAMFGHDTPDEESRDPMSPEATNPVPAGHTEDGHTDLRTWTLDFLSDSLRETLGGTRDDYDETKDLASSGLDSVLVLELNQTLEGTFPDLPQTLFFEYGSLGALTDFFLEHYSDELKKLSAAPCGTSVPSRSPQQTREAPSLDQQRLFIRDLLAETMSSVLGLDRQDLEDTKYLMDYGLDSVLILEVNTLLDAHFPDLPQTLFFEHGDLESLLEYFLENHGDKIAGLMSNASTQSALAARPSPQAQEVSSPNGALPNSFDAFISNLEASPVDEAFDGDPLGARRAHSPFHSVALPPEPIAGFSLARSIVAPEACVGQMREVVQVQAELRQVLFHAVGLEKAHRVIDLGCGIGADLVELASAYPNLSVEGMTVSEEDAAAAQVLIENRTLSDRVAVRLEDSKACRFDPGGDLFFSIQTMHLLGDAAEKAGLFKNLAAALKDGGYLLMADYVGRGGGSVNDKALGSSVFSEQELAEMLAGSGFEIETAIDASNEALNFLRDPDLDAALAGVEAGIAGTVRKLTQQAVSIEKGWVRFCLIKARLADAKNAASNGDLRSRNLDHLLTPQSYAAARDEVKLSAPHVYEDVLARFPEFSIAGGDAP